ncbi:putative Heat shock protein 70 family [Helianthus anomalus]
MEILGMLFKHLKQMTEKNLESNVVVDCVIGIPSYFSDLQRRCNAQNFSFKLFK